jgi:hypothetical protein
VAEAAAEGTASARHADAALSMPSASVDEIPPLLNQGIGRPNQHDIGINLRRIEPFGIIGLGWRQVPDAAMRRGESKPSQSYATG